jgi:hypothetical protein
MLRKGWKGCGDTCERALSDGLSAQSEKKLIFYVTVGKENCLLSAKAKKTKKFSFNNSFSNLLVLSFHSRFLFALKSLKNNQKKYQKKM